MPQVSQAPDAIPPEVTLTSVVLDSKPSASLHCSRVQSSGPKFANILLVFLNGLIASSALWIPVIIALLKDRKSSARGYPSMLAYDRFGQGKSVDRDPQDKDRELGHGHDVLDGVRDLHQLIKQETQDQPNQHIVFVANSIGCAFARLYAQEYPKTVAGMILLDSIIANSDFVSVFPDPDSPEFDENALPEEVTADLLRETRQKSIRAFHPDSPNSEGLSRRNLSKLLPDSNGPQLQGVGGEGPFITIVGHDPERFAQEGANGQLKIPISMSRYYINPTWNEYNKCLKAISTPDKVKGPIIAPNCGHVIQASDPQFVADEIDEMLEKLTQEA